jgi:hypothetical protein
MWHVYIIHSALKGNHIIRGNIDGTRDHHVKQNKPDSERHIFSYVQSDFQKRHESRRETIRD